MNIEKQIDLLKRKREAAYKRFIEPIDKELKKYEDIKISLASQVVIDYNTHEREEQLNRILFFKTEENENRNLFM